MGSLGAVVDAYVSGRLSRLDPLLEARVTAWDDVEVLLAGFRRGDRDDDPHLRRFSLIPLEKARVDRAQLAARLVELLPDARDPEDLAELLADMPHALTRDGVARLIDHCRTVIDAGGTEAAWTHRYALQTATGCDQAPDLVVPWLLVLTTRLLDDPATRDGYFTYDRVGEACTAFGRHPDWLAQTRPVLERVLATGFGDWVRPAGAALHALVGSAEYLATVLPRIGGEVDDADPSTPIEPLIRARADWSEAMVVLAERGAAWSITDSGPRLIRRVGLTADHRQRLEAVVAAGSDDGVAAMLLAAADRPAPAILARFDRLPGAIPRNPYDREPIALVDGDKVWVPLLEVLAPGDPGEWCTDEDRFAVLALDPADAAADVHRVLPVELPIQPTGAAGDKRLLSLAAVRDGAAAVVLREPFADDRGWGTQNYLLVLDRAGAWGLAGDAGVGPVPERLAPGDAWSGGELVAWLDGALHTHADPTPRFLDDWEEAPETTAARTARAKARGARALRSEDPGELPPDVVAALRGAAADRFGLDDPAWEVVDAGVVRGLQVWLLDAVDACTEEPLGTFVVCAAGVAPAASIAPME